MVEQDQLNEIKEELKDLNYINGDVIYDIETYPNCFTYSEIDAETKKVSVFEISDYKNDLNDLINHLRSLYIKNKRMVGFNNIGFDYPVIHWILEQSKEAKDNFEELVLTSEDIYQRAMEIIESHKGMAFGITIPAWKELLRQVDLFKINHFDNKAKMTSLKMLEFNMRSNSIEDLPFPVGSILNQDNIKVLIKYNIHDVKETFRFYSYCIDAIKFRENLTEKYGFDCINFNDTKIGKEYFIQRLEDNEQGTCYTYNNGRKKVRQTKRDIIHLNEVIFDYIHFESPEFNAILNWFKNRSIKETKGVFTDIQEHDLGDVAKYAKMVKKNQRYQFKPSDTQIQHFMKEKPKGWIEERELSTSTEKNKKYAYWRCWNVANCLNVVYNGIEMDFGVGGIHGSIESQIVHSDDEWQIVDLDVKSYYPNLAIKNRIYPEHLGEAFDDVYEDVYIERDSHKKGSSENKVMKLALNGTYGDSNNPYSPFYDPKFTMGITINGQLSLCMLTEWLCKIDGLQLIQLNTDGITVRVKKEYINKVDAVVSEWENTTKLIMEKAYYKSMYIRDVNNYLAIYEDGKVKRKGAYEYENLEWHKNHSALIIPMAVEQKLVYGIDHIEYIKNHKDIFDFMLRTKVPRSSKLVLVEDSTGFEFEQQNICRYYPCKTGKKLIKLMPPLMKSIQEWKDAGNEGECPPRRIGIDSEWNVRVCNNMEDFNGDIDYDYFIAEADKLINPLLSIKENDDIYENEYEDI